MDRSLPERLAASRPTARRSMRGMGETLAALGGLAPYPFARCSTSTMEGLPAEKTMSLALSLAPTQKTK